MPACTAGPIVTNTSMGSNASATPGTQEVVSRSHTSADEKNGGEHARAGRGDSEVGRGQEGKAEQQLQASIANRKEWLGAQLRRVKEEEGHPELDVEGLMGGVEVKAMFRRDPARPRPEFEYKPPGENQFLRSWLALRDWMHQA